MSTISELKNFLLKPVVFMLQDKTVRRGKLLLYHQHDYYIKFTIQTNKNLNKTYEVPYPYKIIPRTSQITFSYLIEDLCKGNANKIDFITSVTPTSSVNKVHNKQLTISVIDDM